MFKLLKTVWQNLSKSAQKPPWYSFSLSHELLLGEPCKFVLDGMSDVTFNPEQLQFNTPCPGFVLVREIKVCNVSMTISSGSLDSIAYTKGEMRLGGIQMLPANRASLICEYTGCVPEQYVIGQKYTFCATFKGFGSIF